MRGLVLIFLLVVLAGVSTAQTETPSPTATYTPTPTPTPEPWQFATLIPSTPDEDGQMTRIDFVATAGDVRIADLLTAILVSMWGMFLFAVLIVWGRRR